MGLLALRGTTEGMAEETLAFYVLLTPVMIAARYDALTAVAVILLGAGVGVLGSTVSYAGKWVMGREKAAYRGGC